MIRKPPQSHVAANDNIDPAYCGLCLHWSWPPDDACVCANAERPE
jgi:hypothetical protein